MKTRKWRAHEILTPPSDEEVAVMTVDELEKAWTVYHEVIRLSIEDPYNHGFVFDNWKRVDQGLDDFDEALILGGNRSSKTRYGARSVVKAAAENPGSEIFCFAQTSEVSVRQQQAAVWEWLPKEYKTKTKTAGAYIAYSKKNGFTDGSLILPNGSQIIFKTYSQFQNNPTILEGAELGSKAPEWVNVGVWLDEYLLGSELIETLRFRLATRNAKMIVTFTPIDGWTEVINDYLKGAKTVEKRPAELLDGEMVPYVQESVRRNAIVIYFHSIDNPFGGYDRIKKDLLNSSREDILIRAYGVPVKSAASKFPRFSTDVNVKPDADVLRKARGKQVTRYHLIDPAGQKNWFMTWIAVEEDGTWYVYREWPNVTVGDWAKQGKDGKWVPGDGAKGIGYGLVDYIELIQHLEDGEEIFERIIDPRLGKSTYLKEGGDSSIIQDLDELDFVVTAAPGFHIEDGLQKLTDKMNYDPSKPVDAINRPRFYISAHCENTIHAMAEYTAEGGKDEAWKDPIDCLRYAAVSEIDHVGEGRLLATAQGGGGY